MRTPSRRGFTLIEMMVTIAVLVILLAVAAPAMQTFTASQRIKSGSFDLYSSLMYARSEAIKRRDAVTITPVVAGDWGKGWEVKYGASVLRTQSALSSVTVTAPDSLTYRMDGRLSAGGAVLALEYGSNPDRVGRRCITVDTSGMPSSRKLTGGATC
jgi:type IV fimbrial biogenesis protein FimT